MGNPRLRRDRARSARTTKPVDGAAAVDKPRAAPTRARSVGACGLPTAAWSAAALSQLIHMRGAPHRPQALPPRFFFGSGSDPRRERGTRARALSCEHRGSRSGSSSEKKQLVVGPVGAVERGVLGSSARPPPRSKRLRATARPDARGLHSARAVVLSRVSVHRPGRASRARAFSICGATRIRLLRSMPNQTRGPAR